MKTEKTNIYEEITHKIIAALEDGVTPWVKPWQGISYGAFRNAIINRPYRGMNIILLNLMALMNGYVDPRWLTFRNADQLGGRIKKGEKGVPVIFWKFLPLKNRDKDAAKEPMINDEEEQKVIPFARVYTVFNVEQCEGLDLPELEPTEVRETEQEDNDLAERIMGLPILKHGGNQACYLPIPDVVILPQRSTFEHSNFYFSTGYHEIVHWTGHLGRLARTFGNRFGVLDYAFEELVAEIRAAFLGAHTAIPFEAMRHPEYINVWLQILKDDNKAIFTASAKAQNAADFVLDKAGIAKVQEHAPTVGELAVAA